MRRVLTLLLALMLIPLGGCHARVSGLQRYKATFLTLFDTVTTVVGYAESEDVFTQKAQFIHDALEEYHQLYDIYHSYEGVNNIQTVNQSAGGAPVVVDQRIIDLLLEAKKMYDLTGGKVNVAMGSVLSIWHDYREAGIEDPEHAQLPPMEELQAAAEHMDINQIIIDETTSTVRLADPEMRLDVGAIAKGYATQRVTDAAKAEGIDSLLLSVGGNVCALGNQGGVEKPWRVGVQDPENEEKTLHVLEVEDRTLVTSGSYQRYYTVDGQIYNHIIDPDTLMPAENVLSVTVLAKDSGDADGLSTALFNLSYEAGLKLLETMPGVEAIWVDKDRKERYSPGFQAYISESDLKIK